MTLSLRDSKGRFIQGHTQINSGRTRFKEGRNAWNKGKEGLRDEKHGRWIGEKASYDAKHQWIYRKLGRPEKCGRCGKSGEGKYVWHNISEKYLRILSDWERLCTKCHAIHHKNWQKSWSVK